MIPQKIVYEILSRDDTDTAEAVALAAVQTYHPTITTLAGLDYKYKSLKTLLEDTHSDWYDYKIFYEKYSEDFENVFSKESSLPKIAIGNSSSYSVQTNGKNHFSGQLQIETRTAHESSSGLCLQIALRIREFLTTRLPSKGTSYYRLPPFCEVFEDFTVSFFKLNFVKFENFLANQIVQTYNVDFAII